MPATENCQAIHKQGVSNIQVPLFVSALPSPFHVPELASCASLCPRVGWARWRHLLAFGVQVEQHGGAPTVYVVDQNGRVGRERIVDGTRGKQKLSLLTNVRGDVCQPSCHARRNAMRT